MKRTFNKVVAELAQHVHDLKCRWTYRKAMAYRLAVDCKKHYGMRIEAKMAVAEKYRLTREAVMTPEFVLLAHTRLCDDGYNYYRKPELNGEDVLATKGTNTASDNDEQATVSGKDILLSLKQLLNDAEGGVSVKVAIDAGVAANANEEDALVEFDADEAQKNARRYLDYGEAKVRLIDDLLNDFERQEKRDAMMASGGVLGNGEEDDDNYDPIQADARTMFAKMGLPSNMLLAIEGGRGKKR